MRAKELIPEQWYYCEGWVSGASIFRLLKHNHDIKNPNPKMYLIHGINQKKYNVYYSQDLIFEELTPEQKLEAL